MTPRRAEYTTFPFSLRRRLPLGATGSASVVCDEPSAGFKEFPALETGFFVALAERFGGSFFAFLGETGVGDN